MNKNNDWKERLNVVYSTRPDFVYQTSEEEKEETLPAAKQSLRIELDKHRGGKIATLITGFVGSDNDLKELAKQLKVRCGVGGSARNGEILIQGDMRQKVKEILLSEGYIHIRII
ncbi:MAG: translation initiation factor [Porphyromonadaceae bacterium]|nr:translation initiation factor [Porphyromonadaceae bacterium]